MIVTVIHTVIVMASRIWLENQTPALAAENIIVEPLVGARWLGEAWLGQLLLYPRGWGGDGGVLAGYNKALGGLIECL